LTDSNIEFLYVFRRPIESSSWPIDWAHMLQSSKGNRV
jgi:hypothetical protein